MTPDDLPERATHYRSMSAKVTDAQAVAALHELAEKHEALANSKPPVSLKIWPAATRGRSRPLELSPTAPDLSRVANAAPNSTFAARSAVRLLFANQEATALTTASPLQGLG